MSLLSYASARPWAKAIKTAVITKQMPPWFADPHYGDFRNAPKLTADQIKTLTAWVDGGSLEGDAAVVEVAHDRGVKHRIDARAGFAVYWLVNLADEIIEVYTQPSGPTDAPDYAQRQDYGLTESVPVLLNGVEVGKIAVRDVLP